MTTPVGHTLGHPRRYTNGTKTIFKATCLCGLSCYGPRLQHACALDGGDDAHE